MINNPNYPTLSGAGAPAAGLGIDGQMYYDTAGAALYLKIAGVWTAVSAGGGGGSFQWIEQQNPAAVASMVFTGFSASYDIYQLEIAALRPATNGVNLFMTVSDDGGATWKAGSAYFYVGYGMGDNDASVSLIKSTAAGQAQFAMWGTDIGNNADAGINITMKLKNLRTTSKLFNYNADAIVAHSSLGTPNIKLTLGGTYNGAVAVNAIKFAFSSGNITSGFGNLYGLKNS